MLDRVGRLRRVGSRPSGKGSVESVLMYQRAHWVVAAAAIVSIAATCQQYQLAELRPVLLPPGASERKFAVVVAAGLNGRRFRKGTVVADAIAGTDNAVHVQARWLSRHSMAVRISFRDDMATLEVVRARSLNYVEGERIHRAAGQVLLDMRTVVEDLVARAAVTPIPDESSHEEPDQVAEPLERFGTGYAKRIAVVIGIDRYERWPSVEGAVRDAQLMKTSLGALGFDQTRQLLDEKATRAGILEELGETLPQIADDEDLVVVYFSGHGQTEELPSGGRRGYLVPIEGDPARPFITAISMDVLRDLAARIPAKHIFFVVDACYSGIGFQRGIRTAGGAPDHVKQMRTRRAVQLITAGTEGQRAVEADGFGLFTKTLAAGLAGDADSNGDGVVTATELGAYVRPQVSAATNARQTPQYGTLVGAGEVVFGHE